MAFLRSHNQIKDTLQANSGLPRLWHVVRTPWWPFLSRPARQAPQVKEMTQREGTAFPHRPVPLL